VKLRSTNQGLIAHDPERDRWVVLTGEQDLLAFLSEGPPARERAARAIAADDAVVADPASAGLPFVPRSMRAFMLWEAHVIDSSRMLVKHFFPAPAWRAVSTFERITGRTFPKLKPNQRFWEAPTFYVANHTMALSDGQEMWWPSHTNFLDFELELACVLVRPLVDATPHEAREAIGGWIVLNDWSARDVQADDARRNVFGPVIKSKTFANSIGPDVVTTDEFGDWSKATGRVRVDGEVWCEGATAHPAHDIGEMLAYASKGERLDVGDVISTGTMPGCCGLELERWIKPGQTVELEIDRIGTVTNPISAEATPSTAVPATPTLVTAATATRTS
jgi:2-keto-4-pentenoate hydratase/2-oxohepta-3-ene-1,7-dioic acid hydratase in catechol pathway